MSNHQDFHTTSQTRTEDSLTGEATLTGEQGDRPEAAVVDKAKNKSNVKLAAIMGVVVLAVGGLGYMAFFKHGTPPPANSGLHPSALTAPAAHPASVTPAAPLAPVAAHSTAAPVTPAPSPTIAPEAPKLTSPSDAQSLLGGAPNAAVVPPGALPGQPATGTPNAILGATPAPAASAALPMGALPTAHAALPASATSAAPASSSTTALAAVTTPVTPAAPAVTAPVATPAQVTQGTLEDRVSHLEDRVTDLEKNQSHILEMLATQPDKAVKASQVTPTTTPAAGANAPVTKAKPKVHHLPANRVEVIAPKAKPVVADKPAPVTKPVSAGCQIASIVPNRAWTKQSDGTFLTYGVGDTAPNGSVIKSIDPETGIITEKGKLTCSLAD